jgi:hypothetical protein
MEAERSSEMSMNSIGLKGFISQKIVLFNIKYFTITDQKFSIKEIYVLGISSFNILNVKRMNA